MSFGLSCLQDPFGDTIYGGSSNCCYTIDCELQFYATLTTYVNSIVVDPDPNETTCPFVILEVNGQPYTNPLTTPIPITVGSPIQLKLSVCPCTGVIPPNNQILYHLIIDNTSQFGVNGIADIYGAINEINSQDPNYNPLGLLTQINLYPCIGTTGCSGPIGPTIPFINYSLFEVPVTIDDTGNNFPSGITYYVDGVAQSSNVILVPGNTTVNIGFGFCWPNATPVNFDIDFVICDIYAQKVTFYINPGYCLNCGTSCGGIDIKTENTYLSDVSGCNFGLPSIYNTASVGEKKTIEWTYIYGNGFDSLANVDIYFNPHLFTQVQTNPNVNSATVPIPTEGWYLKIQGYMIGNNIAYNMYQLTGVQYAPSQKNWEVKLEVLDSSRFKISFTFYLTCDIDSRITNNYIENFKRFYYQLSTLSTPVNNSVQSVYTATNSSPRFIGNEILIVDNNILDPNNNFRAFQCYIYTSIPFNASWYNPAPYQFGVDYVFELLEPVTQVFRNPQKFSTFKKTLVRFEFPVLTGNAPTNVIAYIFTNENFDDTIDFINNNELSRSPITTNPNPSTLNGVIESPSLGPTLIVNNFYYIEFTVGTGFDPTKKYNVAGIVYDSVGNKVNSWIYTDIEVDTNPDQDSLCCPLQINHSWSDYINTYPNAQPFDAVYKERLKNTLIVEGGLFSSDCLFQIFGYNKPFYDLITEVRVNIYKKYSINSFVLDHDAYFLYNTHVATRNVASQFGFNFTNNDPNSQFVCYISNLGELTIEWIGRPRWESWVPFPIQNVFISDDDTPFTRFQPSVFDANFYIQNFNVNLDWSQDQVIPPLNYGIVFFEYVFTFDISTLVNSSQPLYLKKVYRLQLGTYPTEDNQYHLPPIKFNPLYLEGWNGLAYIPINAPICSGQFEHVKAILTDINNNLNGYVIGFINRPSYGAATIEESDDSGPGCCMVQLSSQYIYDVTPGLATGTWEFKIRTDLLASPGNYEICALYLEQ